MNFIENTIFPQSFDSLRKECNTALKTSPGGSKTTFLPIKLQQSIIQAAMYAASANKIQKKSINYNINFSTSHLKLFKISFFIISIVFLTLSLLNPKG